jgi:hypothetical protein
VTPELALQILQTVGPAGLVLVASLFALRHVHEKLLEAQEKRIADAQLAAREFLKAIELGHDDKAQLARAIDNIADAVREQRLLVESVIAERGVHRLPTSRR